LDISKSINILEESNNKIFENDLSGELKAIVNKFRHPLLGKKELVAYFGKVVSIKPITLLLYTNFFQHQIQKTYQQYIINEIKRKFNIKYIPVNVIFLKKK
jgi:predicted GTPase